MQTATETALPRPADPRRLAREDLWPVERYEAERTALRRSLVEAKRARRLHVGPHATFYFENWLTMWMQIQEMLFIERGGEEQVQDELSAYAPLVPGGDEVVATVMFEVPDADKRQELLARLGGVEEAMFLEIDGERAVAEPERDVDRTTADGKASSVQFVHFRLTPAQAAAFRRPEAKVVAGIDHPAYSHMAVLPPETRESLAADLD